MEEDTGRSVTQYVSLTDERLKAMTEASGEGHPLPSISDSRVSIVKITFYSQSEDVTPKTDVFY